MQMLQVLSFHWLFSILIEQITEKSNFFGVYVSGGINRDIFYIFIIC